MQPLAPAAPSIVDFAGLAQLSRDAASDEVGTAGEAVVQFEALMIGMLLKSARATSFGEGFFESDQTRDYLELMDQQVALEMARKGGLGLGAALAPALAPQVARGNDQALGPAPGAAARGANAAAAPRRFESREDFVAALLPLARRAARKLGVDPKVLVAQAALETGWGAGMPRQPDGSAAHNLFGIKAGAGWHGARVSQATLENVGGVLCREQASFRAYSSMAESFEDYTRLIAESPRYAKALEQAADARGYVEAVSAAGYATDPAYAQKWLSIYSGRELAAASDRAATDSAVSDLAASDLAASDLKEIGGEPTT
jgi:flagellar protein FlgJ